jgi:hypothetical protein
MPSRSVYRRTDDELTGTPSISTGLIRWGGGNLCARTFAKHFVGNRRYHHRFSARRPFSRITVTMPADERFQDAQAHGVQIESRDFDVEGNLRRAELLVAAAGQRGAELVLCPELMAAGYVCDAPIVRELLANEAIGTSIQNENKSAVSSEFPLLSHSRHVIS